MIRRPPRSTRTDTLFPYTTLFRSRRSRRPSRIAHPAAPGEGGVELLDAGEACGAEHLFVGFGAEHRDVRRDRLAALGDLVGIAARGDGVGGVAVEPRSEERRVGEEGVSTCRSRWSPYH